MNENPQPVVKPVARPVVRLDKSRDFSTVHGERLPGDRHHNVHYYQDGLPFDSEGILLFDHPEITEDEAKQRKVMKLTERAQRLLEVARGNRDEDDDEDEDRDEDEDQDDDRAPINLEAWARGEQKLEWQLVTNAIAQRFAVRVRDKRGALELLIEERVVSIGQLSREHRKLVQD